MNNAMICTAQLTALLLAGCMSAVELPVTEITVDAGFDRSVEAGDRVALAGMAFPSADSGLTYEWVQTGGPNVKMSGAGYLISSFVAPELGGDAALVFELQVTARDGSSNADTVVVFVGAAGKAVTPGAILAASL